MAKRPTSGTGNDGRGRAAGFTLVELLAVLAILSLAASSVAFAIAGSSDKSRLSKQAFSIATRLRAARALAIRRGGEAALSFNLQTRTVELPGWPAIHVSNDYPLDVEAASSERRSATTIAIRFFANGSSTGGVVRLGKAEYEFEIRVSWFNGRVNVIPPA